MMMVSVVISAELMLVYMILVMNWSVYRLVCDLSFSQPTYNIVEGAGPALVALNLSNPLSFDITVQVTDSEGSATSEWSNIMTKC